jgi:hypothetical protein
MSMPPSTHLVTARSLHTFLKSPLVSSEFSPFGVVEKPDSWRTSGRRVGRETAAKPRPGSMVDYITTLMVAPNQIASLTSNKYMNHIGQRTYTRTVGLVECDDRRDSNEWCHACTFGKR